MTSTRHTEFTLFVLDLLDFMEEKISKVSRTMPHGSAPLASRPAPFRCCAAD
jgi:hypothetical protein